MKKQTRKQTYTVKCPYCKDHQFPVVIEISDEKKDVTSTFEAYCPFCDKPVQVSIKGELVPDEVLFRHFDFDQP